MFAIDMSEGWETVPGTAGVLIKPLSGDFDEVAQRGFRTRYVKFEAGGETLAPFAHTYWEEALLLEGALTTKADGHTLTPPAYVLRPPGTPHGPLISHTGCLLVEVQYFAGRQVGLDHYLDHKAPGAWRATR